MKTFSIYTYLFLSYLLLVLPTAQARDLPNLLMATDIEGEIETEIAGGVSVNQGHYQQQVTQYLCDEVVVAGEMTIDPIHVDQPADILVWAAPAIPTSPMLKTKKTILYGFTHVIQLHHTKCFQVLRRGDSRRKIDTPSP